MPVDPNSYGTVAEVAALTRRYTTAGVYDITAKPSLSGIVVEAVADLCHAANTAGRFFTDRMLERGKSPMQIIRTEMADWVQDHSAGLEAVGVARGGGAADPGRLLFRDTDTAGNPVEPLFQ